MKSLDSFRGKSGFPQRSCDSDGEFLCFTSEHSLNLIADRKGLSGEAKAF
jgi:hypothetical protein